MKVYSTDCPRCKILIKKLQQANKQFELIEDEEEVLKVASEFGIEEVPFVVEDGQLYRFGEMIKRI